MIWDGIKRLFGGTAPAARQKSNIELPWIEAENNPWGVRLLDVRPVTHTMISTSQDPKCAENAISYGRDDGSSFVGQAPQGDARVELDFVFPTDGPLPDGVLFAPRQMEHKWALFLHGDELSFVRSWRRTVFAIANVERHADRIVLRSLRGSLLGKDDSPELNARAADFIVQSHALALAYPAPLPPAMSDVPMTAALFCMNVYGNLASFATEDAFTRVLPGTPLRSQSLLHLSVARGDEPGVLRHLQAGIPVDILGADALAPLHWAIAGEGTDMLDLLLAHGAVVDVRSDEGTTPLMLAVQSRRVDLVRRLLERSADANAADHRGFTALHRAAEMGQLEVAQLLLAHGAAPNPLAGEHTPTSLARARNEGSLIALLAEAEADR